MKKGCKKCDKQLRRDNKSGMCGRCSRQEASKRYSKTIRARKKAKEKRDSRSPETREKIRIQNKESRQRRAEKKEKRQETCSKCDSNFYPTLQNKTKLCNKCSRKEAHTKWREKTPLYSKQYYTKNKEVRKEYAKYYRKKNKEKISTKQKEWRLKNPNYDSEYYQKNRDKILGDLSTRIQEDVQFKMKGYLRTRLWSAIKNNQKGGSAVENLGCTVFEFIEYIQEKFSDDMDWSKWGRDEGCWQLDHIVPLDFADLEDQEEIRIVCHYTNLQPIWRESNLSKKNRLTSDGLRVLINLSNLEEFKGDKISNLIQKYMKRLGY